MATKSNWKKKSPWGDLRDPKQNHKDNRRTERYPLVRLARKWGFKHPGSKRLHTLRMLTKNPEIMKEEEEVSLGLATK